MIFIYEILSRSDGKIIDPDDDAEIIKHLGYIEVRYENGIIEYCKSISVI